MTAGIRRRKRLSSFQTIILGFIGLILLGAGLLSLPISSSDHVFTPFSEALFTATSASCVTGLVVHDTATYWSAFGQAVILVLIQIGGLGVVTIALAFALLSGRRISLRQRSTMQDAISAPQVGGIVRYTNFILKGALVVELAGALLLMPVFVRDFGLRGIWMSFFHSISAFCNAGFDLMGAPGKEFSSLTAYGTDPYVNIVIMLLIIVGGIGFLTWRDIVSHGFKFRKYLTQSKVILVTYFFLIAIPAVFFFVYEFRFHNMPERVWYSLFQAVTARTAGFNTANLSLMQGSSVGIMIVLMIIGGAPGSTAGGMKVTTIAVLVSNTFSIFSRQEDVHFFGRRIAKDVVRQAAALLMLYLLLAVGGAVALCALENQSLKICLFETGSAVATVGLSMGLTPTLGPISQLILIVLMFLGRVGGLTIMYAAVKNAGTVAAMRPVEKINVG